MLCKEHDIEAPDLAVWPQASSSLFVGLSLPVGKGAVGLSRPLPSEEASVSGVCLPAPSGGDTNSLQFGPWLPMLSVLSVLQVDKLRPWEQGALQRGWERTQIPRLPGQEHPTPFLPSSP